MPYRINAAPPPRPQPDPPSDDRLVVGVGLVVGLIACVPPLVAGGEWRTQTTIGLLVAVICGVLLVRDLGMTLWLRLRQRRLRRRSRHKR